MCYSPTPKNFAIHTYSGIVSLDFIRYGLPLLPIILMKRTNVSHQITTLFGVAGSDVSGSLGMGYGL